MSSVFDRHDIPRFVYEEPTAYAMYVEYGSDYEKVLPIIYKNYLRTILSERQNHKCCYCGLQMNDTHGSRRQTSIEHVIPESRGGATDLWNCVAAHVRCNNKRKCVEIPEESLVVIGLTNMDQYVNFTGQIDSEGFDKCPQETKAENAQ
jgi:hypothetical protein